MQQHVDSAAALFQGFRRHDLVLIVGPFFPGSILAVAFAIRNSQRLRVFIEYPGIGYRSKLILGYLLVYAAGVATLVVSAAIAALIATLISKKYKQDFEKITPWNKIPFRKVTNALLGPDLAPDAAAPDTDWVNWYFVLRAYPHNRADVGVQAYNNQLTIMANSISFAGLLALIVAPELRHWLAWIMVGASLFLLTGAIVHTARSLVPEYDQGLTAAMLERVTEQKTSKQER